MSPEEAKGWADVIVFVLGTGGLGGVLLAFVGSKKAKHEEPAKDERPTIGAHGMKAIGGALLAEAQVDDLTKAITALALSQTAATEQKRQEAHSQTRTAEALMDLGRKFLDEVHDLRRAIKDLRPGD